MLKPESNPQELSEDSLLPPVQTLLGQQVSITSWKVQALNEQLGDGTAGMYRYSGVAISEAEEHNWSIYLKIAVPDGNTDESDWNYWKREAEVYASDILQNLPEGLRAPRYLGQDIQNDGSLWLWLEDAESSQVDWSLERFYFAARQLGRFNGSYLVTKPLPDYLWIGRDWLRGWVEENKDAIALLKQHQDHPVVQLHYPPENAQSIFEIWEERHRYYDILQSLPQTLCHMDYYSENLLKSSTNSQFTVLDWAFLSYGAIGEELAALVTASLGFRRLDWKQAHALETRALAGYLEGLRDVGWEGDASLVFKGYAAASAIRFGMGVVRLLLPQFLEPEFDPDGRHHLGISNREAFQFWAKKNRELNSRLAKEV